MLFFFSFQGVDFYDEIEIADMEEDRKDLMSFVRNGDGAFVPEAGVTIDMDNCDLNSEGKMKKQRLDMNYAVLQQQQQHRVAQQTPQGNRRKMPLVNRVL